MLNSIASDGAGSLQVLGFSFPINTDYIAIPAVIASVSTLVILSLLTPRPADADWRGSRVATAAVRRQPATPPRRALPAGSR